MFQTHNRQNNYDGRYRHVGGHSCTVRGESLSIRQIFERYARGMEVKLSQPTELDVDENTVVNLYGDKLHNLQEQIDRVTELSEVLKKTKKEKDQPVEPAEPDIPSTDEVEKKAED